MLLLIVVLLFQSFCPLSVGATPRHYNIHHHKNKLPAYGNELAVYERYMNLTYSMNDDVTWKMWTDCLNLVAQNFRNAGCLVNTRDSMAARMNDLYGGEGGLHDIRVRAKGLADCSYSVRFPEQFPSRHDNVTILTPSPHDFFFHVVTNSCRSNALSPPANLPLGGSSITVYSWNEAHSSACVVTDLFSGEYEVRCPLHELGRSILYQLEVFVDFEHFDAYSDVFCAAPLLDVPVYAGEVRVLHELRTFKGMEASHRRHLLRSNADSFIEATPSNLHSIEDMIKLVQLEELDRLSQMAWGEWLRHPAGGNSSNELHASFGAMMDYRWHGSGSLYNPNSRDVFERIFGKDADEKYVSMQTKLIGESHMRFFWDFMFYLYSGGAEGLGHLDRKHGLTDHIARMSQENIYFVTDTADWILRQNCPLPGSTDVYVLQFGSWDLTYNSLRNAMEYKENVSHFIAAVNFLVKKCGGMNAHESNHFGRISIILVTTSPDPRCLTRRGTEQKACEDKRGADNNFAVSAMVQRVHKGMLAAIASQIDNSLTNVTSSGLRDLHVSYERIDSKWIAEPRFRQQEAVCGNHFICHPGSDTMLLTAAGLAISGEILAAVMRQAAIHEDHYISHVAHTHAGEHEHLEEHVTNMEVQLLGDSILKVGDGDAKQYFYLSSNGLRRLIPDQQTLDCLLKTARLPITRIDEKHSIDIPQIATPLPSRAPGNIYTGDNIKGTGFGWIMTQTCSRSPYEDLTVAKVVFEMDLYNIPVETVLPLSMGGDEKKTKLIFCREYELSRGHWEYKNDIVHDSNPWGKCLNAQSARPPDHNYYCDGYRTAMFNITSQNCSFHDLEISSAQFVSANQLHSISTILDPLIPVPDVDIVFVGDSLTNLIFDAANCFLDSNGYWNKIRMKMIRDDFLVSYLPCHDNCINPAWKASMERQSGYLQNHACAACQPNGNRQVMNETALMLEWNERIPLSTRIVVLGTGAHYHFHLHGSAEQESSLYNQTVSIIGEVFTKLKDLRPDLRTYFVDLPPSIKDTGKPEYEWDLYRVKNAWAHHLLKPYPSVVMMHTHNILFPRKSVEHEHLTKVTNDDLLHWCSPGLNSVPLFIFRLVMHDYVINITK